MSSSIKVNAIKCVHCGAMIVSTFRHDFATHRCDKMTAASGADAFIAADGGQVYLRRCGNREDWDEASEWT